MTNAPNDLLTFRSGVRSRTGLAAVDVGITGDGIHARTGGYHEGMDVLISIGRYHAPPNQHIGSTVEDYSARTARDRVGLTNSASAVDIGSGWRQGRAAWLRWNVALVAALHAGDPALAAVRAINYTVDGVTKHRTDREHGWAVEDSTDTVLTHTHAELYRDTEGRRAVALNRLLALIDAAIKPPAAGGTGMEMSTVLAPPTPGRPGTTAGDVLYDVETLRHYLIGAAASPVPAEPAAAWPTPESPLGKLMAFLNAPAAPITLTDAQVAALGVQVTGAVRTELDQIRDDIAALRAALADGAQASHDALA